MDDLAKERDKSRRKGKPLPTEAPSYKRDFVHIWRGRFVHLHPDVIDIAADEEWKEMRFDQKSKRWERVRPFYWEPCDEALLRSNR